MSHKANKLANEIEDILFSERYFDVAIAMRDRQARGNGFIPAHVRDAAWEMVEALLTIIDREKISMANRYRAKMGVTEKLPEPQRYKDAQPNNSAERRRRKFQQLANDNKFNQL